MQAIMETIFDIAYLGTVITIGLIMCVMAKDKKQFYLFGIMAVILGCGDAFHLIPRVYSLLTDSMQDNAAALGVGKFVTSITMTVFYIILYHIWRMRYKITSKVTLTAAIYGLGIVRIVLCLFPQNEWLISDSSLSWGIYRNIPFVILGVIIVCIFFMKAKDSNDRVLRYVWLAILLSFIFYIPVVLWADAVPIVGMLMIPKTLCYVWLVLMGFREYRKLKKAN